MSVMSWSGISFLPADGKPKGSIGKYKQNHIKAVMYVTAEGIIGHVKSYAEKFQLQSQE